MTIALLRVTLCVVLLIVNAPSRAQTLDFSGAPQAPVLNQFSFTWELHQALNSEIAQRLGAERATTPVQNLVLRATVNYRLVAADLLDAAHQNQPRGSVAFLYGLTIADGRKSLDRSLQKLVDLHQQLEAVGEANSPELRERFARINRMVRLFNEQVTHKAPLLRTTDADELDLHLPVVFSPLAAAVRDLEHGQTPSYWPVGHHIHVPNTPAESPGKAARTGREVPTVEQLYQRSQVLSLPPPTAESLATILEFLQRGRDFADLQPAVARYSVVIGRVFDVADVAARINWLPDDARDDLDTRIAFTLEQFADPALRERAISVVDELAMYGDCLRRIELLLAGDAHRSRIVKPVLDTLLAITLDSGASGDSRVRRYRNLSSVLDRMVEYRELKSQKLRQELRAVQVRLQRLYEAAEYALVEQLPRLVSEPDALADPAMSSHISQQRQYLTDLDRIGRIPAWIDTIALIAPDAASPFLAQSRKMAAWLLESNRRPDATRAMQQFEQQLAMFHPLPFEQQLRSDPVAAAILTGGMHEQLLAAIDDTRQQWAMSWADGDAGSEAANRLLMLYRLMYTLASTYEVQQLDGDISLLNRWGAWQLDSRTIARAFSDLPGRLQLSIAAVGRNDADDLRRQLERIDRDAPLAKLTGRLAMILEEDMLARPDEPLATLGQLMHPPLEDAWLVDRRAQLATLCWHALEQEYARATEQREHHEMLRDSVVFHVDELLAVLGERRDPLPTLSGFDGSDPNPDIPEIRIRD